MKRVIVLLALLAFVVGYGFISNEVPAVSAEEPYVYKPITCTGGYIIQCYYTYQEPWIQRAGFDE